jgi:hypothetical protein
MRMRIFILGLLLALVLGGCATPSQPAQAPVIPSVESPTDTSVPTQHASTLYQTARVATVNAIKTASTTPLPTRTITQTPTIDPDPTSIARATRDSAYDKYCDGVYGYFYDDNWGICDRDSHKFTLFNIDGRVWQYSYEQLGVANEAEGPEYMTRAIYWTNDEHYVYLTAFPVGYDPLGPFLGNGTALFQVNLEDGEIQTVLSPYYFYSISISPTGKYLAYVIFDEPLELVIQDLQSGEKWQTKLEPKYTQAGAFDWPSDESKVAYKLVIDGDECSREYAIRILSIGDMQSTTIVDDTQVNTCQLTDPTYYVVAVTNDSVILEQNGDIWVYKISTQQLSLQATATPTP